MAAYSVAEANAHSSEILEQVEAGNKISMTQRGRPIATIVSAPDESKPAIDRDAIEALRRTSPRSRTSAARLARGMRDAGF
jgi:prevent-host-death family protein